MHTGEKLFWLAGEPGWCSLGGPPYFMGTAFSSDWLYGSIETLSSRLVCGGVHELESLRRFGFLRRNVSMDTFDLRRPVNGYPLVRAKPSDGMIAF